MPKPIKLTQPHLSDPSESKHQTSRWQAKLILLLGTLMTTGCGRTSALAPDQIRLVEAAYTATGGRDLKSLNTVLLQATHEFEQNRMKSSQLEIFRSIHAAAEKQQWNQAGDIAFDFLYAQGP